MPHYRKKPVVIEARQLTGDTTNDHDIYKWVEENTEGSFDFLQLNLSDIEAAVGAPKPPKSGITIRPVDGAFMIITLEGLMKAEVGDWVIKGVSGEFYPCKPDIFEATYEKVSND